MDVLVLRTARGKEIRVSGRVFLKAFQAKTISGMQFK
jgi:hypothetical protein